MGTTLVKRAIMGGAVVAPLALALLMAVQPKARGGEYHHGLNVICSDCHTMHFSQTHAYDGTAADPLPAGGPNGRLLKATGAELCKSCHDGQPDAPDTVGLHGNGYVREAGALNTGAAPYESWKGHTLGATTTAPGGTWTPAATGLECVNCHSVHGMSATSAATTLDVAGNPTFSQYRNLNTRAGGSAVRLGVSYAKGTNDATKDVFIRGWTRGDLANNYSVANVDFNEPVSTKSGLGRWCQACHTNFHGASADANMHNGVDWVRHPAADANMSTTTFKTKLYRLKVMSPTGDWGTQGSAWATPPADMTPTCTTCHKAHGNQNPFGLIYQKGTGPVTEEGDADGQTEGLRSMCKQCHSQGG
ncbi:MAG: hypothetical protein NT029_03430 [Armatimonadetes bacterium]|nr:hypothetical protein [Armatimonadota bacterium]